MAGIAGWGVNGEGIRVQRGALAVDDVLRVCVEVQVGDRHIDVLGHGARRAEAAHVRACAPAHSPCAVHADAYQGLECALRQPHLCLQGMHALCKCVPHGSVYPP